MKQELLTEAQAMHFFWAGLRLNPVREYLAPHANRGTPKRQRRARIFMPFKLFKGHRP